MGKPPGPLSGPLCKEGGSDMAFSTLIFLFAFLPVSLILYHIMPARTPKNAILLVLSLVFYAWGAPEYFVILLFSVLFNYCAGLYIANSPDGESRHGTARKNGGLVFAVVVNVALLCFFKYWTGFLGLLNSILPAPLPVRELPLPIGLSFYTFSVLSYLFDVYRKKCPVQRNLMNFALYVTFFPKVISGPIVSYTDMAEQLQSHRVDRELFGEGVILFLTGLGKKLLLADGLSAAFYAMQALPGDSISVATAWLASIFYSLMLYFDFSGYSDMAIGLGKMFGFNMAKNFDYPYISASITEFWRRWHISLGSWFRDYVYFPLGGSRVTTGKVLRNLLIVWLLTGIWHGSTLTFVFWGMIHGFAQILEKYPLKGLLEKTPKFLRWLGTMLLVNVAWVFFSAPTVGDAFLWVGRMVGIGTTGLVDATAKYYFAGNALLLLFALIACAPTAKNVALRLVTGPGKVRKIVVVVFYAALLCLCIAAMMNATYSTFLYFQF